MVVADPQLLLQAILNLVSNAIKYKANMSLQELCDRVVAILDGRAHGSKNGYETTLASDALLRAIHAALGED